MSNFKRTFAFPGWSVSTSPTKTSFKKVTKWGDNSYRKYYGAWSGANLVTFTAADVPNTKYITDFSNSWNQCSSLNVFPLIDTLSGVDFSYAWQGCAKLTRFPLIQTKHAKTVYGAWSNCIQLKTFPLIDLSNCENFSYAWYNCSSLTNLPKINTNSGTNFDNFVTGCPNLSSAPLQGTKENHSFANCSLEGPALIEIFEGLGDVTQNPKSINITNNPGLTSLQYEDYLIAWKKGWSVVPVICNELCLEDLTCIELETCSDGILPILEKEDKIRRNVQHVCV
jgi:hypothetical protein